MTYDPIAKKAYDKERNAKIKAEYLKNNPNYKPTRTAQNERNQERKRIYLDTQRNQSLNSYPTQHNGSGFSGMLYGYDNLISSQSESKSIQKRPQSKIRLLGNDLEADERPKYNPNGIEAKKSNDYYETPIVKTEPIFFY